MPTKPWRRHNCNRNHRTWNKLAGCMVRNADVCGEGPYARVAWCRTSTPVIRLYQTKDAAVATLEDGCGGVCHGNHEVVVLVRTEGAER